MSRHLDGSPKPPDPLWLRQHETLILRCRVCGHRAVELVGMLGRRAGMSRHELMWRLVHRLRCSACGAREPVVEIGQ